MSQIYDYEQLADADADADTVTYVAPTARVMATYPPGVYGCPDTMTVELNLDAGSSTLGIDIRAAVQALASVGVFAGAGHTS